MKYYVYISDTKLDMLFGQIPQPLSKRIAADLSINLKLVSVSLSRAPSDETRYSKLRIVTEYIEKHEEVGTPDRPGALLQRYPTDALGTLRSRNGLLWSLHRWA